MKLTFEPWAPEYGTSLHDTSLHDLLGVEEYRDLNLHLECEDWQPLKPTREVHFDHLLFLDGRRRVEAKVFAEWQENERRCISPGLLGSLAVGLAEINQTEKSKTTNKACLVNAKVSRVLLLSKDGENLKIPASPSRLGELFYQQHNVQGKPEVLAQRLQQLMRQAETELCSQAKGLLIIDGPLPLSGETTFLGYVKTIHDIILPTNEQTVLPLLRPGERTPLFEIGGRLGRFSWFLCLANNHSWHHSLSSLVRLEVYAKAGFECAQRIADWSCQMLPKLAAPSFRDPRAPQQLMPVAFLERELGRRMGDAGIVRRRIQSHLANAAHA